MLLRQSLVVGSVSTPEDLAGDDDALSAPAQSFDRIPHYRLSITMSVSLGIIEEIHASIVSSRHTLDCDFLADLPTVGDTGAQREFAELKPGNPKLTIVHSFNISLSLREAWLLISTFRKEYERESSLESHEQDSMKTSPLLFALALIITIAILVSVLGKSTSCSFVIIPLIIHDGGIESVISIGST